MKNKFSNKIFKLDNKGKSPALFFKEKIPNINNKVIKKLKNFSKQNQNLNVRICLHRSKKVKMHNMIVLLNKKNKSTIHSHHDTDEVYQIIQGKMQVNVFNKKGKKIRTFTMSQKNNFLLRINAGIIHQTKPLTDKVIFCENRLRPHKY